MPLATDFKQDQQRAQFFKASGPAWKEKPTTMHIGYLLLGDRSPLSLMTLLLFGP